MTCGAPQVGPTSHDPDTKLHTPLHHHLWAPSYFLLIGGYFMFLSSQMVIETGFTDWLYTAVTFSQI